MCSRHCICVLFFFVCIGNLNAQEWLWAVNTGGPEREDAYSTAIDKEGNVYIIGYFGSDSLSFGNTTLKNKGEFDVFVARYNTEGEVVWARSAGGNKNDFGYSIIVDPSGNVCVSGSFESDSIRFGSIVLENVDSSDLFVTKYDALGNVLWAKAAGGESGDEAYAITTDDAANIYITGQFTSNPITFDHVVVNNTTSGFSEIFLTKYDAGGTLQWVRTAAGSHNDVAYSVTSNGADDIYIVGFFRSLSLDFEQELLINTSPAREMCIAKYHIDGTFRWAKRAGGALNDLGYVVTMIKDDALVVSGAFRSDAITFDNEILYNALPGNLDYFVTTYDSSGQVISATSGGGSLDDNAYAVSVDSTFDLFLSGGYYSPSMVAGSSTLINSGDSTMDIFIINYDPDGNILWAESIGGNADDYVNWIRPDASNHIYVVGYFGSSSVQFGETILQNHGSGDFFLAKLSTMPSAIHETHFDQENVAIYPNPASETFMVDLSNSDGDIQISMYNTLGEKLFERKLQASIHVSQGIDFHGGPGIYFIHIRDGQNQFVKKLIIQ